MTQYIKPINIKTIATHINVPKMVIPKGISITPHIGYPRPTIKAANKTSVKLK